MFDQMLDHLKATDSTPQVKFVEAWSEYFMDSAQRSVLFWDALRKRGNTFLQNTERGVPPVLIFDYDILLDGRTLDRPCNYVLMKIRAPEGVSVDPAKRPVVVVDPRAGQGPGVGGFKSDSEIGFALRAGHPVYFVGFYLEPVPGQTLADIGAAESRFLEEVIRRHPGADKKPFVIGNCQAGWAVAALAAVRPELTGPVAIVGAPLSYWAGADSQNPMRYNGGLFGGTWPGSLLADLGGGILDGAWFVQNFENLNPAEALWKKPYDLYSRVDTEEQRFLDFERWWGGYYLMGKEEFKEIVDNLFAGNRLAGGIELPDERKIDLRNITSPVVVFASWGDNISPPQQALNWIVDVYGHENMIVSLGRVIVYLLAEDVGHLSIFVGGRVARREHRELISVMDMLDDLPPGLYEMVIEQRPKHGVPLDIDRDTYTVRFETRTVDDIRALNPDRRSGESLFSTINQVSEINERLYETIFGPVVRALSNEATAKLLRLLHPMRVRQYLLSDLNPFLAALPVIAEQVRQHRHPASEDDNFLQLERTVSKQIIGALNFYRDLRDSWVEQMVRLAYGPLSLGAFFPPEPPLEGQADKTAEEQWKSKLATLWGEFERGGFPEAVARMLIAVIKKRGAIDRRSFLIAHEISEHRSGLPAISEAEVHSLIAEQALLMQLDPEAALKALPRLLPSKTDREQAVALVARIMMLEPELSDPGSPAAKQVKKYLDLDPNWHMTPCLVVQGGTS
jgi:pimeloyl-ACP methyl ester carboxylesterase